VWLIQFNPTPPPETFSVCHLAVVSFGTLHISSSNGTSTRKPRENASFPFTLPKENQLNLLYKFFIQSCYFPRFHPPTSTALQHLCWQQSKGSYQTLSSDRSMAQVTKPWRCAVTASYRFTYMWRQLIIKPSSSKSLL